MSQISSGELWHALRGLLRAPGVLLTAVACLALGIGANAALLGVLDSLFLRPPAHVRDPASVVRLYFSAWETEPQDSISYPMYADLEGRLDTFSELAAYYGFDGSMGRGNEAEKVRIGLATPSFFSLLGVLPARGRLFSAEEEADRPVQVALLSFEPRQRAFGGDPEILGRAVRIGKEAHTVVGILPRGFTGADLERVDLWLPFGAAGGRLPAGQLQNRNAFFIHALGRLAPGISRATAGEQATAVHRQVYAALGDARAAFRAVALGPVQAGFLPYRRTMAHLATGIAATAGLVLLIACLNVANLLIVRGFERRRELALRLALGASRLRLTRLLLAESLLLGFLGGVAAWFVLWAGGGLLQAFLLPEGAPPVGAFDLRMALILVVSSLSTGVLAGLAPALSGTRQDLAQVIQSGAHGGGRSRMRLRAIFLVLQVALTFALLVGAGLFLRSLRQLGDLRLGFVPEGVLLATVNLEAKPEEVAEVYRLALERVRQLPGVESATVAAGIPFRSSFGTSIRVPGRDWLASDVAPGGFYYNAVSDGFLSTLGTRLLRGRDLTARDLGGGEPVALINETMAKVAWPTEESIGRCFELSEDGPCFTVVGIVEDARRDQLEEPPTCQFYVPLPQAPQLSSRALFVRVAGEPAALTGAVRGAVQALSADMPFVEVRPLADDLLGRHVRPFRMGATFFTLFGLLALVLASLGIFATASHAVATRRREMGIRMALGALPRSLLGSILSSSLGQAALGILLGAFLAGLAGRFLEPLLFRVEAADPALFATAALALLAATLLASGLPGLRAGRIDPSEALRGE